MGTLRLEKKRFVETAFSSERDNWTTPCEILERLYSVFGTFDLDPCSPTKDPNKAPVKARTYFTKKNDGLSHPWFGVVYMNPPYGRAIGKWVQKARMECEQGNAKLVIGLVPARTDTKWWHEHVAQNAEVFFLRGRLSFDDCGQSAPFPPPVSE